MLISMHYSIFSPLRLVHLIDMDNFQEIKYLSKKRDGVWRWRQVKQELNHSWLYDICLKWQNNNQRKFVIEVDLVV